jgi:glycosyltransferase involved in cell wall biosynthesis
MNKKLTVSLIIPCYNEERTIKKCLEHVAAQDSAPEEVILVDNNCADKTVEIAKQFPFVTVIREQEQGLIPARNKGFEFARGDILARIDADTRICPGWVRTVRHNLSKPKLHGITGSAKSIVDIHLPFVYSSFWSKLYFKFIKTASGLDVLWGPNMAIKRNAYLKIRPELATNSTRVHEDQDISILMHKYGLAIKNLAELTAFVDGSRSADIYKIMEYNQRRKQTFERHYKSGNIKIKQLSGKDRLILIAMAPLGLWLLLQGLMYATEVKVGARK